MKRLILIYAIVFINIHSGYGQRESCIGVDVASAVCRENAGIFFAHEISQKWSIGAEIYVNMKGLIDKMNSEETEHWDMLAQEGTIFQMRGFREDYVQTSILMQYWPKSHFDGPAFSIGGIIKDRSGPDMIAGAGYCFKIWKGLRADLVYNICLMQTFKERKMSVDGIRIRLSYVF